MSDSLDNILSDKKSKNIVYIYGKYDLLKVGSEHSWKLSSLCIYFSISGDSSKYQLSL